MPWHKTQNDPRCEGWAVVKDDDDALEGCHDTEASADAQLAALYASEEDRSVNDIDRQAQSLFRQFWNGLRDLFVQRAWDGSASNYSDTNEYCNACLIDVNSTAGRDTKAQSHCKLPAKSPGSDSYNFEGIQAAAGALSGARGGISKPSDVSEEDWNAAVKSAANTIISQYNANDETAPDGVYEAAGKTPPERAMSMPRLYEAIYESLWNSDDMMGYLVDCYVDNDGSLYALTTDEGKLYRHSLAIQGDNVTLGERVQVMDSHPAIAQSRTVIRQQPDGHWRWFSISATAVLNRVGEIDSRALFDSFVGHAEETDEYPIRMFYHQGEAMRTGQADWLARDDYCYLTSGLYDDTPLAQAEITARQRDPEYWGESIGFLPTAEPEMVEVAEGIHIPAYWQGVNREISTLPEREAASLFTVTGQQEVFRMALTGKVWEAFLKLWGDDEEAAKRWLEEHPEARNRSIEEAGLITRDQDEEPEPEETPGGAEGDDEEAEEGTPPEVVLDEEAVEAIAARMLEGEGFNRIVEAIAAMHGELEQATNDVRSLGQRVDELTRSADERLGRLEREDDEKQREWVEDLPAAASGPALRVSYRPRQARAPEHEEVVTDGPEALSAWEKEKKQKNMPSY